MMRPSVPYIRWNTKNLAKHYQKRITDDAGCFEELIGIDPPPMSEDDYRQRSLDTVANSWAEYEGEGRDVGAGVYSETRAYYLDDDLVCSITDIDRKEFVTCFHASHPAGKHFHPEHHDNNRSDEAIGNRRIKFKKKIRFDVQGGVIKSFKSIRGLPDV